MLRILALLFALTFHANPCARCHQRVFFLFFFPSCMRFVDILVDHCNNVVIKWGAWSLYLQKSLIAFSVWLWRKLLLPHPILNWSLFVIIKPQRVRSAKRYEGNLIRRFSENVSWSINTWNFIFLAVNVLQSWSPTACAEVWT